jgi:CYTH domain-containing protein/8-oxo-dGTP pyrophosphatase MutT (NUDIX family)
MQTADILIKNEPAMTLEIERKFLVGILPEGHGRSEGLLKGLPIRQGYLASSDKRTVRIRQQGRQHWLTVKTGTSLERQEYEVPLTARQFTALWPATAGSRITKSRHRIALGQLIAELDIFGDVLDGLRMVEVEFTSTDAASQFEPPWWFGPEVTGDPLFYNSTLSTLNRSSARQSLGPLLAPPLLAYGVIPLVRTKRSVQVVIVSTRTSGRWICPKGTPEPGKSPQEVALGEALEEAGVEGALGDQAIPVAYWRDRQCIHIQYWPMLVQLIHDTWQEAAIRKRTICSIDEAKALMKNPAFSRALDQASAALASADGTFQASRR